MYENYYTPKEFGRDIFYDRPLKVLDENYNVINTEEETTKSTAVEV